MMCEFAGRAPVTRNTTNGKVFYRNPTHHYPVGVRGEGVYLYDSEGKQYLDGSGGAAISSVGHGQPDVIAAIRKQVGRMAFAHTAFFTNEPQEALAETLAGYFGEPDARVYFVSGGSEANETALKLSRQYWAACGHPEKHIVISRHQSYHGNTLGALSVSGHARRRGFYTHLLHDWPRIDPCYAYRHQQQDEGDLEYATRCANTLEAAILKAGPENVAAFIAEPVVGATLGAVPANSGYFRQVREICDRHNVLLILDEIMAGCGRTGSYFAFRQENIRPDIVTIAKGLAAGYQPIGAVVTRGHVHERIVDEFKAFMHGHSYVGHATACAAGLAVTQVVKRDQLLSKVRETGKLLQATLHEALDNHPNVGDIRGRGLLIGVELVLDRETREPVRAEAGLPAAIKKTAMAEGLICYPDGGTADGHDGAHVLLAPPFIFEPKHVDELVAKLRRTLEMVSYT
jgi:adenosylmethionine-8-amino-7-oxononanoate aminotransferase